MATLLDGYTMNWKNLTVDLSKQWRLSDSQLKTLADYGYTYTYINEPQSNSGGSTNTNNNNNNYNPLPDTGSSGSSSGGGGGGNTYIEPPKTWENYWSKMNNPAEISKYLNGQSGFSTRVLGDRIVGTKNGVRKVWKFDGTNWVAEDQKGWDYYAKLNDANEVAFYLNSQDGFNVKTAGSKITGTKNWVQTTWAFDGANWVPSATAQDVATKTSAPSNGSSPTSTSSTTMQAGVTNAPTDTNKKDDKSTEGAKTEEKNWDYYSSVPDAAQVTTYLNTQPGFNTSVARDPVTNEVVPNKIEGTKDWVKKTWTFDGANWVSDQGDSKPSDMQVGAVTTENITTAQLNKLIEDRGIDVTKMTAKQKAAYDRLVIKAQENDKKATTTDTEKTGDELTDTEKTIENMLDEKKDVNQLLVDTAKEWVKILKEKIENIVKPMQEKYDKLSAEWWNQEVEFQKQYEQQWNDVARYENESRAAIKELEDLGRKQYKDYVSRVARVVSGRKAAISGELSAQGFNANVISNITSQVDTQYADERLKVQTFLSDVLDKSLARQRDLYTDLFNRRSSLTAAQQSFRNTVGECYKYLYQLKQDIAEAINGIFAPIEEVNKTLTGAYTPVATSSATSAAYAQEWKQGDENKRISQLSSQLHNFLGSEKNPDGTAKYDTNKIPTEKLAEFAKLPTAAEAYRAAVDYLMGQNKETPTSTPVSGSRSTLSTVGTTTSTVKSGTGTKSTTDTNVSTTQTSVDTVKKYLLEQAKLLNGKGGFAKTNTSFEAFSQQVNNAKTKEDLDNLAEIIKPAIVATPQIKKDVDFQNAKNDAFTPFSKLTEAQKILVRKSPLMRQIAEITQKIQTLKPVSTWDKIKNAVEDYTVWWSIIWAASRYIARGDEYNQLNNFKKQLEILVNAALAGQDSPSLINL